MIEQLETATDAALLAEAVELEAELSRVQFRQLSVLAELNSRNVAGTLGYRGLSQLIATQLRCSRVRRGSGIWRWSGSAPGGA